MVPEKPCEAPQEVSKVPQGPPEEEVVTEQTKGMEGRKTIPSRRSSAQQGKPVQPKPSHTTIQPGPQTDPESSLLTKDPLAPLSSEESKTRENNIAHMKHMKSDEEIRKEKDQLNKVCMESDRAKLNRWLENMEMVLRATKMSPVYIPTVNEEWIKAAKQKPTPVLENPEEPLP